MVDNIGLLLGSHYPIYWLHYKHATSAAGDLINQSTGSFHPSLLSFAMLEETPNPKQIAAQYSGARRAASKRARPDSGSDSDSGSMPPIILPTTTKSTGKRKAAQPQAPTNRAPGSVHDTIRSLKDIGMPDEQIRVIVAQLTISNASNGIREDDPEADTGNISRFVLPCC